MSERPLTPGARYLLKTTTQTTPVKVDALVDAVDLHTLGRSDAAPTQLDLNALGAVRLRSKRPLVIDAYSRNRVTARSSSSTRARTTRWRRAWRVRPTPAGLRADGRAERTPSVRWRACT
ncbi:MAG: hypothetical protein PGN13_13755 [Patulibacter minatonensis]